MNQGLESFATTIGIVSTLVGLISVFIGMIAAYFTFKATTNSKLEAQEKKLASIQQSLSAMQQGVQRNSQTIARLEGIITTALSDNRFVKKQSPLNLTDAGWKLLRDMGGESYVQSHKNMYKTEISERNPKSPYDLQQYCFNALFDHEDSPEFKQFKDYAFEQGLSLLQIVEVLGIYLRNELMDEFNF